MQKVISVCRRVEGHGDVQIIMKEDEISSVEFDLGLYRGFENILVGKKLEDIPKIASKICGLCHASQSIVSCKAIENIFNIKANQQSMLVRRLMMSGELIKSHLMHFFFNSLPDLLDVFNLTEKTPDPYELINYNPSLTSKIYELMKIGNQIDKMFGGRSFNAITTIPGGVIYNPNRKNLITAQKYFQKAKSSMEWLLEFFTDTFSSFETPEEFKIPKCQLIALNNSRKYDRYEGLISLKSSQTKIIDFEKDYYARHFNKESTMEYRGINLKSDESNLAMVGPTARKEIINQYPHIDIAKYFDIFHKSWRNSILNENFIRLIEIASEVESCIDIIEEPILNSRVPLPTLKTPQKMEGIGVLEAPRGILMHHYRINKKMKLEEAKLLIATEFKLPLINEMITRYARKLYEKEDINSVKLKVQKIIRAFDPCIACATH